MPIRYPQDFPLPRKQKTLAQKYLYPSHRVPTVETKQKEDNMTTKKLYEVKLDSGEVKYGYKLAVNFAGDWVMEIKGTGEVFATDRSKVEPVMPYTIGIKSFWSGESKTCEYLAEKGKFNVGEVYVLDLPSGPIFVQVVAVDTKSEWATTEFKPSVMIQTVKVS